MDNRNSKLGSVIIPRFVGLFSAALYLLVPTLAHAVPVHDLVAERATNELAATAPQNGEFDVRISADLVQDGEFISDFWIDEKTGQFIANVVTEKGDTRRIWGMVVVSVPIPVPKRRIMPGEIVVDADIETVPVPWQRVNTYTVLNKQDLVGKQVKRMLARGRPVQTRSVVPPIVISRGQKVLIEFERGALRLSVEGKAISDAYMGQEVRVVNLTSNKTIVGIAKGDGTVEAGY